MHELFTPRLRLRPLSAGDRRFYISLYTDAGVMHRIGAPMSAVEAARAFERSCRLACAEEPRYRIWVVVERSSGTPVGLLGLQTTSPCQGEIGAMLVATAQRRGYTAEAIGRLTGHAFDELGMTRVHTRHRTDHEAAHRLMVGLGFALTGEKSGQACWELHRAAEPIRRADPLMGDEAGPGRR